MIHKVHKKMLKEGNIVPIFLNWKDQKEFRGNAMLINRIKDKEPDEDVKEYEFAEIGSNLQYRKKEKVSVVYSYQRWVISFVDGPMQGFRTSVNISYYKKTLYGRQDYDE